MARSVQCKEVLCHGDFHPRNIIIRTDGTIGLVDYEEVVVHDTVWDIATLLAHFLLRVCAFPSSAQRYRSLSALLLRHFFASLTVPLSPQEREYRIKHYAAGWMMLRIAGLSRAPWITHPQVKQRVRNMSYSLMQNTQPLLRLIKHL